MYIWTSSVDTLTFLLSFFFYYKSRSNLKVRATKYRLDNVSSYGLKLTSYADN